MRVTSKYSRSADIARDQSRCRREFRVNARSTFRIDRVDVRERTESMRYFPVAVISRLVFAGERQVSISDR